MTTALERYRSRGHQRVEGWLLPIAVDTICRLAEAQRRLFTVGPACEIGVHHGRLFILIHLLTAPGQRSVAIDLFEEGQEENVDRSGDGNQETLRRNLRAHGGDLTSVRMVCENSMRLTPAKILEACGAEPGIFSIDGGHTAEVTRNDLRLAHDTVRDAGIVILDDYFNPAWPGVSEGTCLFMAAENQRLEPVAVTGNKVLLAHGSRAATAYRQELASRYPHAKLSEVFGRPVLSYEQPTVEERLRFSGAWRGVRDTLIGRTIRRARFGLKALRSR